MNLKYILGSILFFPLLPLMYIHGKRIKASVPKLPEAAGKSGTSLAKKETNKTIKMLAIGESTIAGVGVKSHEEGFTGSLARELSKLFQTNVDWKVYARSGYTAETVRIKIIPKVKEENIHLIVLGLGGNDAFNLRSPNNWRIDIKKLINELRSKYPNSLIVFCSMPPIKGFPAFTPLIKKSIGNLVEILGEELADLVNDYENVYYQNEIITLDGWNKKFGLNHTISEYFSDGVHPSKITYQTWGRDISNVIFREKSAYLISLL